MNTGYRILFFFLLPIIAILSYPPATLLPGAGVIALVALLLVGLGLLLMRGNTVALTFAIFLQGMNVIIRLMMFLSHAVPTDGGPADSVYILTSLLGLGLSIYLMLRLDANDIRATMKA